MSFEHNREFNAMAQQFFSVAIPSCLEVIVFNKSPVVEPLGIVTASSRHPVTSAIEPKKSTLQWNSPSAKFLLQFFN